MHVHAVVGGAPEAVGEVEQRLGDAAGDVGEDQVGDDVVGLAQPAGQLGEQAAGDDGATLEPAQEVLVGQRGEGAVGDGGDGGRARTRVEERELAEHLAGAEDRQQVLAAVAGGAAQLHLAVEDDVELVAGVALVEEHVAAAQAVLAHRGAQRRGGLVVEGAEERCLAEHVVVHGGLLVGRRGRGGSTAQNCACGDPIEWNSSQAPPGRHRVAAVPARRAARAGCEPHPPGVSPPSRRVSACLRRSPPSP